MCDEAVDGSLAALKLVSDLFVTSTMVKNENILYLNEDSANVIFSCNEIGILNIDFNNINIDNIFNEDDPDTIIIIRLLACHIKLDKGKALKKR